MTTFTRRAISLAGAAIAAVLTAAAPAGVEGIDRRIDNRAIVHLRDGATLEAFIAAFVSDHPDVDMIDRDQVPGRAMHLLEVVLPPNHDETFIDMLADDLERNYTAFLYSGDFLYVNGASEGKTGSTFVDGLAQDDFQGQYASPLLGVVTAHARSRGAGTVVAVVDTGVDATHPGLAGRVLPFGHDFVDDDEDPDDTGNGVDDDKDGTIDEMVGHGTFVAGLITLVAPEASILPVRVLDSEGNGDAWALTKGLFYAIDHGVEVINVSLSSTYDTVTIKQATAEAARRGIVFVAAAGNFNRNTVREYPAIDDIDLDDPIDPPLEIDGALGVAATDPGDVKATFSNFHRKLVISAPGAIAPDDPTLAIVGPVPGGSYAAWEGTSFATALVSGTAALVRGQHPEWPADLQTYLAVEAVLTTTAVDIYPMNPIYEPDRELGAGRVDSAGAVATGPVAPGTGDLNADGRVDFADLLTLLAAWGEIHSSADLDGDGDVGVSDLIILLAHWG